jgi:cellulose synthase/poly-beta-1,6-N-acetylglucosamine synthase-like glycosyltransferase
MVNLIIFWTVFGLIVYAYLGFPALLLVRGLLPHRPVRKAPIEPRVSLIIVAHNEAASIGAKIENVYALDYPSDRLEVIVASDGSDDGTNELVASYTDRGLRLLEFSRAGKIPALNAAASLATGDVLVFSDANSMYPPDALRALIAPFADPAVGGVGGDQCYVKENGNRLAGGHAASLGERLYWTYDRLLKTLQTRAGNMTSATGAIHAVRRHLFQPVPLGVSDDFVISTRTIAQGYRLVFERDATAYETVAPTDRAEFDRKKRVIVRALAGLWAVRQLLNPLRYGFYTVQLASHKLLRWSVCWLLPVLFGASLSLYSAGPFYRLLALAQVLFYAAALVVWTVRDTALVRRRSFKVLSVPYYFCMANYAALRAWVQMLGGKRVDVWDSKRPASSASPALRGA